MRIGLGLGITGTGSAGEPPVITATSAPTMAALDDSQTPSDGFTAGSYQSSEGTISSAVVAYLVNGSPQAGTFDLTAGDVVSATETVTDSAANERVFSTGTVVVTPSVALANSVVPAISGTPEIGQTLSVSDGTWTGSASRTYSYQWTRDGADIDGATANTYTLVAADDGADIGCTVTADDGFTTVPADAVAVAVTYAAPVASGALPDRTYDQNTGVQTVDASGDFTGAVGGTWSVSGASASIDQSGVVSIPTSATLSAVTVTVTYTNSGGSDSSAFSVTVNAESPPIEPSGEDITRRSVSSFSITQNVVSDTGPLPAGLVEGDIVVVSVVSDLNPDGATVSASNITFTTIDDNTGGSPSSSLFIGVCGASTGGTVTVNLFTGRGAETIVACAAYSGVDTTTPQDAAAVTTTGGTGTPDPGALTTVTDGAMRVIVAGFDDEQVESTMTPPSGFTTAVTIQSPTTAGSTVHIADALAPTAGTLDPGAFSESSGATDDWRVYHLALRPAP